ncbi:cupredoxin family protein [Pseudohalocynthiibacter sp. F2068]|jgi:uncharacterized cupredoxin-like copper-binding protein|uniref:cupredoxin domain-containing protein n=1 Tax=Pseudohalocynthiibacter sp. F2068 TaxID=2926418 RepID=UPI001FF3650E|nr:cupredoxin family protein [Pseudohalocynthiibacter sp. F2068]MCK0102125.1 cupredoxin family protein [Pseudohalocynthiibacter sp. F2068]
MKQILLASAMVLSGSAVLAGGSHSDGHGHGDMMTDGDADHHAEMMEIGRPSDPENVTRVIEIKMMETEDGDMIFEPTVLEITQGETIKFAIENIGEQEHEFVMDTMASVAEHKALMEEFPFMEHDDPNAVRLLPGEKAEIIWSFVNDGGFEFACLIPGHYESGMHGPLAVIKNPDS